jgi:hypothetical protein
MVFYYSIRGGPCQNAHDHISLDGEQDIVCYVGRDKHENEHLIKYGWPGDIWFHVDSLSSAHVYFRIKNLHSNLKIPIDGIPIDDLPVDTIYDMMQICKNNSIQGSKLASCKMVYTPHSNLKKTFSMDSGTVTYHDTKLCRYGRCEKDRPRIKQLEKRKSDDLAIDFFQEFQNHKNRMIQRKKQDRANASAIDISYDPMLDDLKSMKHKATRQGDNLSGIDAALEGIDFTKASDVATDVKTEEDEVGLGNSINPIWMQEDKRRLLEGNDDLVFLCERGYGLEQAKEALSTNSKLEALKVLFLSKMSVPIENPTEEREMANQEEREVLQAIFGEDDPNVKFEDGDTNLDSVFPITSYQPPKRYELPPPLLMEVYATITNYPNSPPVLAIKGGGLPESLLNRLTGLVKCEAVIRAEEEPGDPQLFNLLTFVGEQVAVLVEEEDAALRKEQEKLRKVGAQAAKEKAAEKAKQEGPVKIAFSSDGERRAYAQQVLAAGTNLSEANTVLTKSKKTKKRYNTGVSDKSLIEDLFG